MGQHNSWDEYCDFLAQPAQGAGDVNHYGDIGLLIGLSGAYQLSINCVTSCPGESWLIIINATIHDYCETVTVAREGRLQEHYYATKDVNLSDLDVHLIHAARQAMPITLRLGSALRYVGLRPIISHLVLAFVRINMRAIYCLSIIYHW